MRRPGASLIAVKELSVYNKYMRAQYSVTIVRMTLPMQMKAGKVSEPEANLVGLATMNVSMPMAPWTAWKLAKWSKIAMIRRTMLS
jgi:hypothetical protein